MNLKRILIFTLASPFILCAILICFAVSNQPELALGWQLSPKSIARAKRILHEGSKTKPQEIGTIELSQVDLNLAANYLLNRYSESAAFITLKENKLKFVITTTLPENRLGKYLNITFRLGNEEGSTLPTITKFKAGKLLLPAKLAAFVISAVIENTSMNDYFMLATRPIKAVKIDSNKITITYFSDLNTLIQARDALTHTGDDAELEVYQQKLSEVIARHDPGWRLSLAELLKPLFQLAWEHSTPNTAIEENKKVIIVVNDYVNKQETHAFIASPSQNLPSGKYYPAFLYKRSDLAQHFIASAALTATVNSQLSKAVGEEKELSDAQQGGSGFSFVDLAADKAGTRLGEVSIASADSARKLQQAMANIKDYSDFMPDPRDLPENMGVEEFNQRYKSVDSPTYQALLKQIDDRIAQVPLYRE